MHVIEAATVNDAPRPMTSPNMDGVVLEFDRPKLATKRLAVKTAGGRTKVVVSSNLLRLFGFDENARVIESRLPTGGVKVELVRDLLSLPDGLSTKKVYVRGYRHRKSNPLECQLEVSKSELMQDFKGVRYAHVTMKPGIVLIRPLEDLAMRRVEGFREGGKPFSTLVGCTSGVDIAALRSEGFTIDSVIEFRPNEPRDGLRDFTETGIMNILRNGPVDNVFNEDIMQLDLQAIADAVMSSPSTLWHFSPVCSSFSNGLRKPLKDAAFEDGTSTLDMTFDILDLIRRGHPACVLIENAPGYFQSDIRKALSLKMRKWGYRAFEEVLDARDHGGLSKRRRYYGFFSSLPADFAFEGAAEPRGIDWSMIEALLPACRDVTDASSIRKGVERGLLRVLNKDSDHCPTIMRCQSRMTKDTVVIEHNGRLYHPSIDMLCYLQGIPTGMAFDAVTSEQAVEIIGQGIDVPLHESVVRSIKAHIAKSAELLRTAHEIAA